MKYPIFRKLLVLTAFALPSATSFAVTFDTNFTMPLQSTSNSGPLACAQDLFSKYVQQNHQIRDALKLQNKESFQAREAVIINPTTKTAEHKNDLTLSLKKTPESGVAALLAIQTQNRGGVLAKFAFTFWNRIDRQDTLCEVGVILPVKYQVLHGRHYHETYEWALKHFTLDAFTLDHGFQRILSIGEPRVLENFTIQSNLTP